MNVIVSSEVNNTLEAAIVAVGLVETLQGKGQFPVFAPTGEAYAALPDGTLEALLAKPSGTINHIFKYHMLAGKIMSTDLSGGMTSETLSGNNISVPLSSVGVFINDSKVIISDIRTDNGVVHVIGTVLVPGIPTRMSSEIPEISEFRLYSNPATVNITIDPSGIDMFSLATVSIVRMYGSFISEISMQLSVIL